MCIGRHETYPSFFCQILMKLEFSRQVLEKSLFHENSFRGAPVVPCGRTDTTKLIDALVGRDTSVDIATRYGLDGPGIGSRWGRVFRKRPDRSWGPPSLHYHVYRVFPGGKAVCA